MDREEVTKWLKIMKANLNSFPEVSNEKKIEALGEAIRLFKKVNQGLTKVNQDLNKSEIPTSSDDCISRAYLLDDSKYHTVFNDDTGNFEDVVYREDVEKAPSVTSIRPKGHWIVTAEEYYKAINEKGGGVNDNTPYFVDDIACSECLAKFCIIENEVERFDFCPNCGADMRGEK